MLREQLQQVPPLIEINQDIQPLQHLKVLLELHPRPLQPQPHRIVVRLWHLYKLDAPRLQVCDVPHDVVGPQRNVLHAGPAVEVDVLLDLGLLLAVGGLVDGHLDDVVGRRHDDGLEGGELRADILVVDGPEAVEAEDLFVVGADVFHLVPVLVADAVVDVGEEDRGKKLGEGVGGGGGGGVAGEEGARVGGLFDEGVGGVAVGFDGGKADGAVDVGEGVGGGDGLCACADGGGVDGVEVVDFEGNVWDGLVTFCA